MKYLKLFEDHQGKFKSIKQDINDIMVDVIDNPSYDVVIELFDYSNSSVWQDYRSTKFPTDRPEYNSGLRINISKIKKITRDYNPMDDVSWPWESNNEIKDSLERVLDYLKSEGIDVHGHEYKYSNNPEDAYLPYTSDEYPKGGWSTVRLSLLLWI